MPLPDFVRALPALDLPVPEDIVSTYALRSDQGLAVFFVFHRHFEMPEHSHKGQWGTVIEGRLDFAIDGETTSYTSGQSYDIPSGTPHAVVAHEGTIAFDIFEEPDRYPLRPR